MICSGSNDARGCLLSKEKADNSNCNIKLIPEVCFEHIEKQVHRERRKKDEERVWTWFVEEKMQDLQIGPRRKSGETRRINELELMVYPELEENNLAEIGQDVVEAEQEEEGEEEEEEEEEVEEEQNCRHYKVCAEREQVESPMGKEKAIKKCHSDPAMSIRRRGYARQLLRAVHTGKCKQVSRGPKHRKLQTEKYPEEKKDESRCKDEEEAKSASENESEIEVGQSRRDIYRRIQLDRGTIHRIETMGQKILLLLDQISYRLDRIPAPDGENDLERRQRRAMEFAVRFSRNYLYDLSRLVTRLQRNVEAIGRLKARYSQTSRGQYVVDIELTERELVTAHQLLLHALTAYCNHIPGAVLTNDTARLTELLLKLIIDLKEISEKLQLSDCCLGSGDTNTLQAESDKELRLKCEAILTRFAQQWGRKASKQVIAREGNSLLLLVPEASNNRRSWNRGCCTNRLKMYNVADPAMAKPSRKLNPRAAGIIRRSRANKRDNNLSNKSKCAPAAALMTKLERAGRDVGLPSAKIPYPINQTSSITHRSVSTDEDPKKPEVATMMGRTLVSTDSERAGSSATTDPCSKSEKNRANPPNASSNASAVNSENETALPPLSPPPPPPPPPSENYTNLGGTLHRFSKSAFTLSNDEFDGPAKTKSKRDASCQASGQSNSTKASDAHYSNFPPFDHTPRRLMLSEKTEKYLKEYRCHYQRRCRSRPMYSNNTRNKPWDIVSWISDKLVEELLVEVAKELQINSVIRKMFQLEFRDF